jgi:hypothetical protein
MRGRQVVPVLLTLALVACSTDATDATPTPVASTLATTAPDSTEGATTDAPTTTAAVTTSTDASIDELPARYSTDGLPLDAPCAMTPVPAAGQTTFVFEARLWAIDGLGAFTCLADLEGRNPSWIQWSPDGDEVLIGPDVVLRDDGRFIETGYFPENRALRWSEPTGKALIAPNAQTGALIWRNAHDSTERIDVSFMARTTTAVYHPAGKHIVAAGEGNDGLGEGIFLASNRGANPTRLGSIEHGQVTGLAFDATGESFTFLHTHPDGATEVHRYTLPFNQLDTLQTYSGESATGLVSSAADNGAAAWVVGDGTDANRVELSSPSSFGVVRMALPTESVFTPLSWLPGERLLVEARPAGAPDGVAGDVWQWSNGQSARIIDGVQAAAARTPRAPYLELSIIEGSGFG